MKRALLFLLAAIVNGAAQASPYTEHPLDFSLHISHHNLTLDDGSNRVDTRVDRVGVSWVESYGRNLRFGLVGGYSFLTQTDNPPTAGRELHGYHAGVVFDLDLLARPHANVSIEASWLYQKTDDNDGTQRVDISWREPSVSLRFGTAFASVRAYAGVRYGAIDGEQRLSGVVNETRTIRETDRTGGFAGGAELALEGNGYVGVAAATGFDRRVGIYFGRQF